MLSLMHGFIQSLDSLFDKIAALVSIPLRPNACRKVLLELHGILHYCVGHSNSRRVRPLLAILFSHWLLRQRDHRPLESAHSRSNTACEPSHLWRVSIDLEILHSRRCRLFADTPSLWLSSTFLARRYGRISTGTP